MSTWEEDWLVGSRGLYHGQISGTLERIGAWEYGISDILREPDRLVAAAAYGSGLWEWPFEAAEWRQLHDETLTEIIAIAAIDGDPGVLAGSPYGVAVARRDAIGAARWTPLSDNLRVNERYTNALLVHPSEPSRWLVATEAGVLLAHENGTQWERTSLSGEPTRTLLYAHGAFWAGTDTQGVWRSADGRRWDPVGSTVEGGAIFHLAACEDRLLAATEHGLATGDGSGVWTRSGPRALFAAAAAHPENPSLWLAGAAPGGLWFTDNAGQSWRQIPGFVSVWSILPPERKQR